MQGLVGRGGSLLGGSSRRVEAAIRQVQERFPFPDYVRPGRGSYGNIGRTLLKHLPIGSSVLDFGAGPADATAVAQALGYRCTVYDDLSDWWHLIDGNRERILEFARGFGIDYRLATDRTLPFAAQSFDLVMCHDVLEHLHDSPKDLMTDLVSLLRPGGLLFATVPNAVNLRKRLSVLLGRTNLPPYDQYYWHPGPWRGHVREYTRDDLARMATYLGLEVVELDGRSHMLTQLPAVLRPVWQAVTSVARGWRDTWMLVARRPEGWTPRRTVPAAEMRPILQGFTPYRYA